MLVGKLVRYTDWVSSAGFAVPDESLGLVISISDDNCLPNLIDVLLPGGTLITVYADEIVEACR